MTNPNICPTCGKPLPPDAPMGVCPNCLLAPTGQNADVQAFEPPTPEELAAKFPQLQILELIGRGGMGAVYKARQPELDRVVALKILPPSIGEDPAFAERFAREARALAKLSHSNIVTLFEFGNVDGLYFFLMEFVDGVNLRQAMNAGRFTPKEALAIVPPVCEALQYAHENGVVHRDIKPENLLLDKNGRVKIADFGVARIVGQPAAAPAAETVAPLGTPRYMAPEQNEDPAHADHRVDIYAMGVVLYELLTGETPKESVIPPSKRVEVDVRIDEIVLRALEAKPAMRYPTALDFRTEIEACTTVVTPPAVRQLPAEARFSRLAIWGAIWAAVFFVFALPSFFIVSVRIEGQPEGRPLVGELFRYVVIAAALVGMAAPIGTTLLGWIAVSQIRRAPSRIYGLGLALFDGILFPLLTLNIIFISTFIVVLRNTFRGHADEPILIGILLLIIAMIALNILLVRAIWRMVNGRPAGKLLLWTGLGAAGLLLFVFLFGPILHASLHTHGASPHAPLEQGAKLEQPTQQSQDPDVNPNSSGESADPQLPEPNPPAEHSGQKPGIEVFHWSGVDPEQPARFWAVDHDGGQNLWTIQSEDVIYEPPILSGNRVFLSDGSGAVTCVEVRTGDVKWKRQLEAGGVMQLELAGEILMAVSGYLPYALNAETGEILWISDPIWPSPIGVRDGIVYALTSKEIRALEVKTGAAEWTKPIDFEDGEVPQDLLVTDDQILIQIISRTDDEARPRQFGLAALSRRDGELFWRFEGDPEPLYSMTPEPGVANGIAVANGRAIFNTFGGNVYALKIDSGELIWRQDFGMPAVRRPEIRGDQVRVLAQGNSYFFFDLATGEPLAQNEREADESAAAWELDPEIFKAMKAQLRDPDLRVARMHDSEWNGGVHLRGAQAKAEKYYLAYLERSESSAERCRIFSQLGVLFCTNYHREFGEEPDYPKARMYFAKALQEEPARIGKSTINARLGAITPDMSDEEIFARRMENYRWLSSWTEESARANWLPLDYQIGREDHYFPSFLRLLENLKSSHVANLTEGANDDRLNRVIQELPGTPAAAAAREKLDSR